jgi:hypothetical protein
MIRDIVKTDKAKNPAPYKEFNELLSKVLAKYNMTFNTFAKVAASLGVEMTFNRLRDVYYERVLIAPNDIAAMKKVLDAPIKEATSTKIIETYRNAVDAMCRSCANNDKNPTCWDATCPLRPVSPLPLRAGDDDLDEEDDSDLL